MSILDRWKHAVVHLECAADSVDMEERIAHLRDLAARLGAGNAENEDLNDWSRGSRDVRFRGTAILLEHQGRRYLLTARHVLTDFESATRSMPSGALPDDYRRRALDGWIFPIIFRVPGLDELVDGNAAADRTFLMNLGAGVNWMAPYTFSDASLDVAIVSLDQRDSRFADDLLAQGYRPISVSDIADGPSGEGARVFSVGYPDSTAVIGQIALNAAAHQWASAAVSLPVFSWGRVGMRHAGLPFFWADLTIYPGNSGGPVVEDGKLVGIVSAQAVVEGTRVPFAKAINASEVVVLLNLQMQKDLGHSH